MLRGHLPRVVCHQAYNIDEEKGFLQILDFWRRVQGVGLRRLPGITGAWGEGETVALHPTPYTLYLTPYTLHPRTTRLGVLALLCNLNPEP